MCEATLQAWLRASQAVTQAILAHFAKKIRKIICLIKMY